MPLYEYKCEACSRTFSILQMSSARNEGPKCPVCGSGNVKKLLSNFACRSGFGGSGGYGGGGFGGGSGSV